MRAVLALGEVGLVILVGIDIATFFGTGSIPHVGWGCAMLAMLLGGFARSRT